MERKQKSQAAFRGCLAGEGSSITSSTSDTSFASSYRTISLRTMLAFSPVMRTK